MAASSVERIQRIQNNAIHTGLYRTRKSFSFVSVESYFHTTAFVIVICEAIPCAFLNAYLRGFELCKS